MVAAHVEASHVLGLLALPLDESVERQTPRLEEPLDKDVEPILEVVVLAVDSVHDDRSVVALDDAPIAPQRRRVGEALVGIVTTAVAHIGEGLELLELLGGDGTCYLQVAGEVGDVTHD